MANVSEKVTAFAFTAEEYQFKVDNNNKNNYYYYTILNEFILCSQNRLVSNWIQVMFFDWLSWHEESATSVLQYSASNALKLIIC